MSYTLKQKGSQIDKNLTSCDITVATIVERDGLDTTLGRISVGKRIHVLEDNNTYKYNGVGYDLIPRPVTSIGQCDITVATIAERDAITDLSLGKQVHVLNNGSGHQQTYFYNGVGYSPVLLDFVDFDTTETIDPQLGRIGWDADEQTLAIGLPNGVTLQVGQEMNIRAKNITGSTILNGQMVYISGASGNRAEVMKAIASDSTSRATIAMATQDILNNQNGYFTTIGLVHDLDTSAFAEGAILYLSSSVAGGITTTIPPKPNYTIKIGYVIRSHSTLGLIFIRVDGTPKLNELSNVDIISPVNGDNLYYDSTSMTWKRIEAGFNIVSRWDDIILPSESLGVGSSAPDLVPFVGNTRITAFDGGNISEQLYGSFEIPHSYKEGTVLRPHIHWCPLTTQTGTVKWQFEYVLTSINTTFLSTTTTIVALDTADGVANQHLAVEFGVIDGTNIKIGNVCRFRLFRNPTDVQDTYTADAGLLSLGIHFEIDGDGSRTTFVK